MGLGGVYQHPEQVCLGSFHCRGLLVALVTCLGRMSWLSTQQAVNAPREAPTSADDVVQPLAWPHNPSKA
jgi:hypothetical protein